MFYELPNQGRLKHRQKLRSSIFTEYFTFLMSSVSAIMVTQPMRYEYGAGQTGV